MDKAGLGKLEDEMAVQITGVLRCRKSDQAPPMKALREFLRFVREVVSLDKLLYKQEGTHVE